MPRPVVIAATAALAALVLVAGLRAGERDDPPARSSVAGTISSPAPGRQPPDGAAGGEGATATAAALGFLATGPQLLAMDEPAADARLRAMASRSAAEDLVADLRRQRAELRAGFGPGALGWWVAPLATRVLDADAGTATVEVWYVAVVAPAGQVAYEDWRLARYRLVREGEGWRVADEEDRPGPRPAAPARPEPAPPGALAAAVAGFVPVVPER